MTAKKPTPMMEQWHQCKKKAEESVLLFRMGDFYEAFYDDAVLLSQHLELTLTQRQGIPMSGIPYSTVDTYVDRLISKGFKVAIAEQLDERLEQNDGKKIGPLARDIQRFVTPGTLLSSTLLHEKSNNYIVAINRVGSLFGFACLDLSTGSFLIQECENTKELVDEICRLSPSEVLACNKFYNKEISVVQKLQQSLRLTLSTYADWAFEHKFASQKLTTHFQVASLDGFGLKGLVPAINAAGGLLSYIQDKLLLPTKHIAIPKTRGKEQKLLIDTSSQVNLELLVPLNNPQEKSSLLHIMDHTSTPMGGRLLRQILLSPFYNPKEILLRQDAVEFFLRQATLRKNIKTYLCQVRDIERLMTKVTTGWAGPRDIGMLRDSFSAGTCISEQLGDSSLPDFFLNKASLDKKLSNLIELLSKALNGDLPLRVSEGNIFVDDFHNDLKRLRYNQEHSQEWLWEYQERIRKETGIKKLKVCFAQALGYYIEVSSEFAPQLPKNFIRRQSRLHAERFTTVELQQFQDDMFNISDKLQALETQLFKDLCSQILQLAPEIATLSQSLADIDYIISLAELADTQGYCRPRVDASDALSIYRGCHPVVKTLLDTGKFIPNDTEMHNSQTQMILLTGPNMAGKSTYIRQVALLVIMAQMGSYIPAKSAHIGVVDKIFTRIGAGDNLSKGMSTFMVEMAETANILHNATDRSLVILDEIGRGTSTYDGLAIAQAVVEYLLFTDKKKAKTLFATHYKELTTLEDHCPHVENFHAGVKDKMGQPVFLYEILKGHSQKSFGIHVARLAGFPLCVISRAQQILRELEGPEPITRPTENKMKQLTLF
ncbi:DNA mismatch repair protein mutS,DNA mismatch repair protein MutS,ATP phosphoribosyltransferase,DNA mismatch repair protein MutS,MutS domain V [Chlamydia serpentis]|uniref:DNA mismatch repair protein MutS n=1 Tax=Chlamydia serpentis TaxID=1967782 RepID=A0A2R8FCA1_9CHLA|nr:DNA mismatch repair protein MutS [Chlamydia serpentis]SPN74049.1 DNA mismatch repair protein mutS,DNA mismatch repair protein MutS,ATP phosphoribosyltransferase,DNA mismatch repair protein MutS,MutS domain V [Chlamydia serpentis]